MLRTQQGCKVEVSNALPRAGPSGLYSFQYVGVPPASWGVPCMRDRSTCSLSCVLLLGCVTVFLLLEIASRPLPVRHWSGACGTACQQLRSAQVCGLLLMALIIWMSLQLYEQPTPSQHIVPAGLHCCTALTAKSCLETLMRYSWAGRSSL